MNTDLPSHPHFSMNSSGPSGEHFALDTGTPGPASGLTRGNESRHRRVVAEQAVAFDHGPAVGPVSGHAGAAPTSKSAEAIFQLLHPLLAEDLGKVETYEALAQCLKSRKVAIAELGYWHLIWLSGGKLPQGFNAAMSQEDREKYAAQIHIMIEKKQLPPMAPMGGSGR